MEAPLFAAGDARAELVGRIVDKEEPSFARFRERAQACRVRIRIQKLRATSADAGDLLELEWMLPESGVGAREDVDRGSQNGVGSCYSCQRWSAPTAEPPSRRSPWGKTRGANKIEF
jgi:hypothetical protein